MGAGDPGSCALAAAQSVAAFKRHVADHFHTAGVTAELGEALDVLHAIDDGDAGFQRHRSAGSQAVAERSAGREVDRFEPAVEGVREAEAALLSVGELDAREAERLS